MTSNSSTSATGIMTVLRSRFTSHRRLLSAAALSLAVLSGCNTSDILAVSDPDILNPDGLQTAVGADPLRYGVISDFTIAFDGSTDSFATVSGNMADELRTSDTFAGRLLVDKRFMDDNLQEMTTVYLRLHKARAGATYAIKVLKEVAPTPKFNIGQLYVYRGFTEDFFGELYCSGVPFSELDGTTTILGEPQTTAQVFTRAAATFDSALVYADTSTRVKYAAAVGLGRVLLNQGKFAAAAAAVAGVPTSFRLQSEHCFGSGCNENGIYNAAMAPQSRYTPTSNEGINGLNFLPAIDDPRLPWTPSTRAGFNSAVWTPQYMPVSLKPLRGGPNVLADGIEARLIEAEARLQGGTQADRNATFALLNELRATGLTASGTVGMDAIPGTAPTTQAAAVDQLFRERGIWLYLTGHRLGDMRRLIRQYGRGAETVFPTGEQGAPLSGSYGTDVNFPVPASEKNNPNFTGCIDRKA